MRITLFILLALSGLSRLAAEEVFTEAELKSLYSADLGPDTIDVSGYPKKQQENYGVFAAKCSQCHSLSRAVNSPITSRAVWKNYIVVTMRLYSGFSPAQCCTKDETKALLDFLVFDSKERKVRRREEFETRLETLERRFSQTIEARARRAPRQK